jgi:Ca2+-binding RTX toxin-like protein
MQSAAVPQLSPLFFGMPYAMTPRFVRVRPGVASFAETPYRDWVLGSAAADMIATGGGDDLAVGGAGNDVIDGGSGTNTALFLGRRHDFAISRSRSAVVVTDTTGDEGSDTLSNIQFLQFADERVSVNEGLPPPTVIVTLDPPDVSGQSVSLRWRALGGIVAEHILEAGTSSGLRDLYITSLGASTSISALAPPGKYFVRIRVRTTSGPEVLSNEVSFSIGITTGCNAAPPAPAITAAVVVNNVATLAWAAVPGATSYVVQAGTASGASDLFDGNVGANVIVSADVSAGFRAYVRVLAANACGISAPSAERLLQ